MEEAMRQLREFCRAHSGFRVESSEEPSELPADSWRVSVGLRNGGYRIQKVFYVGAGETWEWSVRYRQAAAELIAEAARRLAEQNPPTRE